MLDLALGNPSEFAGSINGRARALCQVFQDRHVPLTPVLAERLAEIEHAKIPAAAPFWGRAYGLAGDAIGNARSLGQSAPWAALFGDFCRLLVEPMVREAARQLGRVHLLGTADVAAREKGGQEYTAYCTHAALSGLIGQEIGIDDPLAYLPD